MRNCDNFQVLEKDVKNILNWKDAKGISNDNDVEVSFKPARVILQGLFVSIGSTIRTEPIFSNILFNGV